jgi:hypothetical protein
MPSEIGHQIRNSEFDAAISSQAKAAAEYLEAQLGENLKPPFGLAAEPIPGISRPELTHLLGYRTVQHLNGLCPETAKTIGYNEAASQKATTALQGDPNFTENSVALIFSRREDCPPPSLRLVS